MTVKIGKAESRFKEAGRVLSAESTKDYWSYMERQGNQHRGIDTDWTGVYMILYKREVSCLRGMLSGWHQNAQLTMQWTDNS